MIETEASSIRGKYSELTQAEAIALASSSLIAKKPDQQSVVVKQMGRILEEMTASPAAASGSGSSSGISLVSSAYASSAALPLGAATTLDLPLLEVGMSGALLRGAGAVAGRAAAVVAAGVATEAAVVAAAVVGGAVAYDAVMRPVAEFGSRHIGLDGDYHSLLTNPSISEADKAKIFQLGVMPSGISAVAPASASRAPVSYAHAASALTPMAQVSAALSPSDHKAAPSNSSCVVLDQEHSKPQILSTPIPDDRDRMRIFATPAFRNPTEGLPQGIKDEMWRKMQSDSLRAPSSQPTAMTASAYSGVSAMLSPDLLKPTKLREGKIEVFADGREVRVGEFSVDKPFAIAKDVLEKSKHQAAKSHLAKAPVAISLPAPPDPDDFDPDHCHRESWKPDKPAPSESDIWKSLKPHNAKTKTNGLSGKDARYYQWDYLHGEIEVYNRRGKPIDSIDPITGKSKCKDVSGHNKIDL